MAGGRDRSRSQRGERRGDRGDRHGDRRNDGHGREDRRPESRHPDEAGRRDRRDGRDDNRRYRDREGGRRGSDDRRPSDQKGGRDKADPRQVFVRGLGKDTTEDEAHGFFEKMIGEVTRVKILFDGDGRSKGIGFVTFRTEDIAQKALGSHSMDSHQLDVRMTGDRGSGGGGKSRGKGKRDYDAKVRRPKQSSSSSSSSSSTRSSKSSKNGKKAEAAVVPVQPEVLVIEEDPEHAKLGIKDLKELLTAAGMSFAGATEKSDLVKLLSKARAQAAASDNVFKATSKYQVVPKGMALPRGLEVKFDMQKGINFARLPQAKKKDTSALAIYSAPVT